MAAPKKSRIFMNSPVCKEYARRARWKQPDSARSGRFRDRVAKRNRDIQIAVKDFRAQARQARPW